MGKLVDADAGKNRAFSSEVVIGLAETLCVDQSDGELVRKLSNNGADVGSKQCY